MIWSTSYYHVTVLVHRSWPHLLFTVASVHRRQILLKLHCHTWSLASKPPTCPSHLQPVRRAKSCLDLLHLDHMTPCHVSYAMSSFIITCASFATYPSYFHLHGIYCSHTCTCRLITYVSHINIISSPKVVTQLPKSNKDLSRLRLNEWNMWHRSKDWTGRLELGCSESPTTLFHGSSYLSPMAGSISLSWPFCIDIATLWA
jgi:hypothetical protein